MTGGNIRPQWAYPLLTHRLKFLGPILRNRYADFAFEIYADPAGADRGADRRDDAGRDPDSRSSSASASRFTFDLPLAEYGDAINHRWQCRSDSVIFRDQHMKENP